MHFYDEAGVMVDTTKKWSHLDERGQIEAALGEGLFPSITTFFTCLRHPHIENWLRKISVQHYMTHGMLDAAVKHEETESSELGTKLHDALEYFLRSNMKSLPEGLKAVEVKLVTPFVNWARKNIQCVIACEKSFGSRTLGYGGTMDLAYISYDLHYVTADFKFKKHTDKYPMKGCAEYGCQLSGYETHFEPIFNKMGLPLRRQNYLMNSGLGRSAPLPVLKIVDYKHDFLPMMKSIQEIWKALRNPQDKLWWEETYAEGKPPVTLETFFKNPKKVESDWRTQIPGFKSSSKESPQG